MRATVLVARSAAKCQGSFVPPMRWQCEVRYQQLRVLRSGVACQSMPPMFCPNLSRCKALQRLRCRSACAGKRKRRRHSQAVGLPAMRGLTNHGGSARRRYTHGRVSRLSWNLARPSGGHSARERASTGFHRSGSRHGRPTGQQCSGFHAARPRLRQVSRVRPSHESHQLCQALWHHHRFLSRPWHLVRCRRASQGCRVCHERRNRGLPRTRHGEGERRSAPRPIKNSRPAGGCINASDVATSNSTLRLGQ